MSTGYSNAAGGGSSKDKTLQNTREKIKLLWKAGQTPQSRARIFELVKGLIETVICKDVSFSKLALEYTVLNCNEVDRLEVLSKSGDEVGVLESSAFNFVVDEMFHEFVGVEFDKCIVLAKFMGVYKETSPELLLEICEFFVSTNVRPSGVTTKLLKRMFKSVSNYAWEEFNDLHDLEPPRNTLASLAVDRVIGGGGGGGGASEQENSDSDESGDESNSEAGSIHAMFVQNWLNWYRRWSVNLY